MSFLSDGAPAEDSSSPLAVATLRRQVTGTDRHAGLWLFNGREDAATLRTIPSVFTPIRPATSRSGTQLFRKDPQGLDAMNQIQTVFCELDIHCIAAHSPKAKG